MNCESCGMPMEKAEDYGAADLNNKYCKHCTDENGNLKSREDIREGWVNFVMKSENISREQAENKVDEQMTKMPAWKE